MKQPVGVPDPGRPAGDRGERAILVATAAAAVAVAWVWASGQLSTRLRSGRWLPISLGQAPGVLASLLARPGHPEAALPAAARPLLAGVAVVAAVAAALGVAAVVMAWAGWRLWRSLSAVPSAPTGRSRQAGRTTGARWATRRDLGPLTSRRPRAGHLVVGRVGRRLVSTERRHSVLVFGPTQSGKTTSLAVPAILEWQGPVVATSVKGDLAAATLAWRSSLGRCWVFDPTATTATTATAATAATTATGATSGWSPLAEAGDWRGAQRVAGWMVDATPARSGLGDGAFWFAAAAKQLAPLLVAARCGGLTMADVVRWTNGDHWEQPASLLRAAGQVEAAEALAACEGRDDRIRSSVATTLETVLAPFEDPTVIAATAGDDIDPAALLEGANSLYICGPSYEQARLQGLLASLVSSVVAAAVERATRQGRPLEPPLLLVLDEAANIAPIRDLDSLASTGAGFGIQLVTVCQDLAQLGARYGPERSRTIANNHRAKLVLSGVADIVTLDLISGLAGEQAVREDTTTADLRDGRRSRSSSVVLRRLVRSDELRQIRPAEAVLIYGHLAAARLRLRPWYADRELRRRASPR